MQERASVGARPSTQMPPRRAAVVHLLPTVSAGPATLPVDPKGKPRKGGILTRGASPFQQRRLYCAALLYWEGNAAPKT
jgi:hypothetical protein